MRQQMKERLLDELFWLFALGLPVSLFVPAILLALVLAPILSPISGTTPNQEYAELYRVEVGDTIVLKDDVCLEVVDTKSFPTLVVDELGWGNNRIRLSLLDRGLKHNLVAVVKTNDPNNRSLHALHDRRM